MMDFAKNIMINIVIVLGLSFSISSAVYSQSLTAQDIQDVRRVIRLIEDQKAAISNALNIALMQKDVGIMNKLFKQTGYLIGACFLGTGAVFVLNQKELGVLKEAMFGDNKKAYVRRIKDEVMTKEFILKIMAGFIASYAALYIVFEYFLPDSGVQIQKDALQQLIRTLEGQKQSLEGVLVRGEYLVTT